MEKRLSTPAGEITYDLARKKVKNLNIRIRADGGVAVSAPLRVPKKEIEEFLFSKAGWIQKHREKILARPPEAPCRYTKEQCLALFAEISEKIFPLFAELLQEERPLLKVRHMKSRWGTCHVQKRAITLNTRLAEKPEPLIEYVILHEYVHFLHPNHGAGFHAEMERLMPDYKIRRKLLRE